MKTLLALTLLAATAAPAQAGVNCKFNGRDIVVSESLADYQYSASGKRDRNGNSSMLRLLTLDASDGGDNNSVELKTVDVSRPGDYPLSLVPGWRSNVDTAGGHERVTGGTFHIKRFEVSGFEGRAVGTVDFTTDKTRGVCSFDVPLQAMERDRLGG